MPYIKRARRIALSNGEPAESWGEINYLITSLLLNLYDHSEQNYDFFNSAVGCLENVKLELYRRLAAPYEDGKASENGDIFNREAEQKRKEEDANEQA